eukprot:scaffold723_cov363-Prasinococcus_capsulatus_cf.AAC.6
MLAGGLTVQGATEAQAQPLWVHHFPPSNSKQARPSSSSSEGPMRNESSAGLFRSRPPDDAELLLAIPRSSSMPFTAVYLVLPHRDARDSL